MEPKSPGKNQTSKLLKLKQQVNTSPRGQYFRQTNQLISPLKTSPPQDLPPGTATKTEDANGGQITVSVIDDHRYYLRGYDEDQGAHQEVGIGNLRN